MLITLAVREKGIKGAKMPIFKILFMVAKQRVTSGFKMSRYKSHRASV